MAIALFGGSKVGVQIKIAMHNVFITMTNEAFILLGDTFGQMIQIVGHWSIINFLGGAEYNCDWGNYLSIYNSERCALSVHEYLHI